MIALRNCQNSIHFRNSKLWERYSHRRRELAEENHNQSNERMLFHGSPFIQVSFDSRLTHLNQFSHIRR